MKMHVVFQYQRGFSQGCGSAIGNIDDVLPTMNELDRMCDEIKKSGDYDNVVILNWLPIKG